MHVQCVDISVVYCTGLSLLLARAATPQNLLKPAGKQGSSVRMNGATEALSPRRGAEVTPLRWDPQAALNRANTWNTPGSNQITACTRV